MTAIVRTKNLGTQASVRRDPAARCLAALAKAVVVEGQPLHSSWRELTREYGLRGVSLQSLGDQLIAALNTEAELFGGNRYRELRQATQLAVQSVQSLFNDYPLRVHGLPALGFAADDGVVELVAFADEPEALIRTLLERQIDYQSSEQGWATRATEVDQAWPALSFGTPGLDVLLSILPERYARLPLFQQGQAVWMSKIDNR